MQNILLIILDEQFEQIINDAINQELNQSSGHKLNYLLHLGDLLNILNFTIHHYLGKGNINKEITTIIEVIFYNKYLTKLKIDLTFKNQIIFNHLTSNSNNKIHII